MKNSVSVSLSAVFAGLFCIAVAIILLWRPGSAHAQEVKAATLQYKFVRCERDYLEDIANNMARKGWRLKQVLAPVSGKAQYIECFEK